jgi:hypothetical protein
MPEATETPNETRRVTVDIARWKMRDRIQFTEVASADDNKTIDLLVEKGVVTAWSFDGAPSDREAWLNLELEDFSFVVKQVLNAAQERFRRGV